MNERSIPVTQTHWNQNNQNDYSVSGSWSSSSSSFLTNSFGSEFDSNELDLDFNGDDEDEFIAQLTRQMTDYMLDDNDVTVNAVKSQLNLQNPNFQDESKTRRSYADTVKNSIPDNSFSREKPLQQPQIQMHQVENQSRVGGTSRLRGGKMNELTQLKHNSGGNRGGVGYGSGMRAIFLNGSGTRNVTSGTGVFLPRSPTDATDHSRKKPGCSTVLVPTRVLQALEQHFNNMESLLPSNSLAQTRHNRQVKNDKRQTQESVSADHQDSKLPQEWIY